MRERGGGSKAGCNSLPAITTVVSYNKNVESQANRTLIYAMIDNILRFDRQTFCRAAKAKPKVSLTGGVGDRKALINQSLNDAQSQIEQKSATSVR